VVLPSKCFAEKLGTFSNTERRVQMVRPAVEAPGEARDDWAITCGIAERMGYPMTYSGSEEIFRELCEVTPSYGGLTYERLAQVGIHWPCPVEDHPGTPILHRDMFTRGKGAFFGIDYRPPAEAADDEYPFYLTTGRVLYHYHTGTMTMKSEGLNERSPESFVEISREDAEAYDLSDGALVNIASRRGSIDARVQVSEKAMAGTVFIPFHFALAAANKLTNAELDPISGIPEYKVCAVKISAAA
jgi:formate dehydrogenase major subunit/formate dehydrogenase alpha subunit